MQVIAEIDWVRGEHTQGKRKQLLLVFKTPSENFTGQMSENLTTTDHTGICRTVNTPEFRWYTQVRLVQIGFHFARIYQLFFLKGYIKWTPFDEKWANVPDVGLVSVCLSDVSLHVCGPKLDQFYNFVQMTSEY